MTGTLPVLAGSVSTLLFVASALPMLVKAARTGDLGSYSVANLALANLGNVVYAVYVFSLPAGPIWALHTFYMISSLAMLGMWVGYARHRDAPRRADRALPRRRRPRPANGKALFASLVLRSSARDPGQRLTRRPQASSKRRTVGGATVRNASRQIAVSSASPTSASSTPSHPRWPTYGGRKNRSGSVSTISV
jgi:hypothetical protein